MKDLFPKKASHPLDNLISIKHQNRKNMAVGFTYRHYIPKDHLGNWFTITYADSDV